MRPKKSLSHAETEALQNTGSKFGHNQARSQDFAKGGPDGLGPNNRPRSGRRTTVGAKRRRSSWGWVREGVALDPLP